MESRTRTDEASLAQACVSGSQEAWAQLYSQYIGLVRSVVKRKLGRRHNDAEDIAQTVFASLVESLENYDPTYSLPRFICVVTERICIQEYRKSAAAKRSADTEPLDLHDGADENFRKVAWDGGSQEEQFERQQLTHLLREGLKQLGEKCRDLLRLRYFEERPFKEIARTLNSSENTVTVQTKRCLDQLRGFYHEQLRHG